MNYILFDDKSWKALLPLTFTRPISEIRIGIMTIREKWERMLNTKCSHITQPYLSKKFPTIKDDDNVLINGSVIPTKELVEQIKQLQVNQCLCGNNIFIAARIDGEKLENFSGESCESLQTTCISYNNQFLKISFPWEIFKWNGNQIEADYKLITAGRKSAPLSDTNRVLGRENIFLEEGAKVECSILNASEGFMYIAKDAEIMEGSIIRGSFALGEHSIVKMGAKIYGPTTVGHDSRVGGEVNNSVIFSYSNKGHDGFLGNSVLGEWCNLGADTNNSNLKNNYAEVKLWSYEKESFIKTGLQFCGLVMGDHSKCGINTMFNTGTVVGVSANIFGDGFPRNFVPSFSWGGAAGFSVYGLNKAFETMEIVMERRGIKLDETEKAILSEIFEMTQKYRKF